MTEINNSISSFLLEAEEFEEFVQNEAVDEEILDDMENSLLSNKKLKNKDKVKKAIKEGYVTPENIDFLIKRNLIDEDLDISLIMMKEELSMYHAEHVQRRMKKLIDIAHRHIMSKLVMKNPKLVQDASKLDEVSDHTFKKVAEHVLKHADKFDTEEHEKHAKDIHSHLTSESFVKDIIDETTPKEDTPKNIK